LDAGSHTPAVPQRALACFFRCVIGLPHEGLGRLPANNPLETTSCGTLISGRQIFLDVPASKFVLPPRSSPPLRVLPQGSRGVYVRAERASLPPHAPDMLTVQIQAIDGTRTFTSLDSRPCRPLPLHERHLQRIIREWTTHYNRGRPHSALGPGLPEPISEHVTPTEHRHRLPLGYRVVKRSVLGGLHHEYGLAKEAA
jgi:hypothetical protein